MIVHVPHYGAVSLDEEHADADSLVKALGYEPSQWNVYDVGQVKRATRQGTRPERVHDLMDDRSYVLQPRPEALIHEDA